MARAWNGLQGLRIAWQEAVWCCSAPDTLEANISVSDVWDHSAKTGGRLLALGVSVFCFDKVLRRRHRGSVTQRKVTSICASMTTKGGQSNSTTLSTRVQESYQRIENSLRTTNTTRWHKGQGGTPSFHRHSVPNTKFLEGNWPGSTTQKGSQHTFLLLHISHHILLLCCHSPSTVRKRLCCCDSSTRELLWHSEHKERGESRDSALPLPTSLISWHERSIDKWQLDATRPSSQSSRKREITSLDLSCPMTSRAMFSTLCSQSSKP